MATVKDQIQHPDFAKAMEKIKTGVDLVLNGPSLIGVKPKVGFVLLAYPLEGDDITCAQVTNDPSKEHLAAILRGAAKEICPIPLEARLQTVLGLLDDDRAAPITAAIAAYLWPGKVEQ